MADHKSLGIIGFILGGVTAVVIGLGAFVVQGNLSGRLTLDDSARPVIAASLSTVLR